MQLFFTINQYIKWNYFIDSFLRTGTFLIYSSRCFVNQIKTGPGRVAQSVTCLTADTCLSADPWDAKTIMARSHTSWRSIRAILVPSADSRRVVFICARNTENRLVNVAQEKV